MKIIRKKSHMFALKFFCLYLSIVFNPVIADDISNANIDDTFAKVRQAYQALKSYSDNGTITATAGGMTTKSEFVTKLSRPDLYKIEKSFIQRANPRKQMVWSIGEGDYFDIGNGTINATSKLQRDCPTVSETMVNKNSRLMTLTVIGIKVPQIFFDVFSGENFLLRPESFKGESEQKVDQIDCLVFSENTGKTSRTIWVGKKDFLLHQIEEIVTDDKNVEDSVARKQLDLEKQFPNLPHLTIDPQAVYIEKHSNILMNPLLNKMDFSP